MFLSISVLVLNALLTTFQVLLVGAIGSTLELYSRFGGDYANSIRWVHAVGFREMIVCQFMSFNKIPTTASIALFVTIVASILSITADIGASHFIHLSERQGHMSTEFVNSTQFSLDSILLFGWSTWIPYGGNITEATALLINNTRNIPSPVDKRMYMPKRAPYTIACNIFDLALVSGPSIQIPNSCGTVQLPVFISSNDLVNSSEVINNGSQVLWSVTLSWKSIEANDQPVRLIHRDFNDSILIMPNAEKVYSNNYDGLNGFPTTSTTSQYNTDGSITVISQTTTYFSMAPRNPISKDIPDTQIGSISTDTDDELLQRVVKVANSRQDRTKDPIQLIEARAANSSTDVLACRFYIQYECEYHNVNTVILEPRHNPFLNEVPSSSTWWTKISGTIMKISHYSVTKNVYSPNSDDTIPAPFSISMLRNKTSDVTQYISELSQYFYMNGDQVFMIFDTIDPQYGFEIPLWLLILMSIVMVTCISMFILINCLLDKRYRSSLYSLITMEVVTRINSTYPELVKSRVEPFKIENVPVIPDSDNIEMREDNINAGLMAKTSHESD